MTASLGIPPNLSFGANDPNVWMDGSLPPKNGGEIDLSSFTVVMDIRPNSPMCKNLPGNLQGVTSADCNEVGVYQIASYQKYAALYDLLVDCECTATCEITVTTTDSVTTSNSETVSSKLRDVLRDKVNHKAGVKASISTEAGVLGVTKVKASLEATYSYENEKSSEKETENALSKTTGTIIASTQVRTIAKKYELPDERVMLQPNQLITEYKSDIWIPFHNADNDYPLVIKDSSIFRAWDLPGEQYYIHIKDILDYPTTKIITDAAFTDWDYCNTGRTPYDPNLQDSSDAETKSSKVPVIHFMPTENHAKVIVTDQNFKPLVGVDVEMGIPSFSLTGGEACISPTSISGTDFDGAAYFYLSSGKTPDVYSEEERESQIAKGLVGIFGRDFKVDGVGDPGNSENGLVGEGYFINKGPFALLGIPIIYLNQVSHPTSQDELDSVEPLNLDTVTISAWIKTKALGELQTIVSSRGNPGSAQTDTYHLYIDHEGYVRLAFQSRTGGGGNNDISSSPIKIQPNVWHHVAGVLETLAESGTKMTLYVDGQEVADDPGNAQITLRDEWLFSIGAYYLKRYYSEAMRLGAEEFGMPLTGFRGPIVGFLTQDELHGLPLIYTQPFNGWIDEVAIYNKALSENDIKLIRDSADKAAPVCEGSSGESTNQIKATWTNPETIEQVSVTRNLELKTIDISKEERKFWVAQAQENIPPPDSELPEPYTDDTGKDDTGKDDTGKDEPPVDEPDDVAIQKEELLGEVQPSESICGPGTYLKDGKCVLDDRCGEGTYLKDGQCVIDDRCGPGTIMKDGTCVIDTSKEEQDIEINPPPPVIIGGDEGGGCLIATATFGTELSPQVQQLRELRDNNLLQTESGSAFMTGFNQLYYVFSPTIADWERENPVFKEAVKLIITPMMASLSLLNYVDMDSEAEVLGYGISLILLNVGMYIAVPAGIGIFVIRRKF